MTTSRDPARQRLPRDVREAQVLDAASVEFSSLGYAGASLAAIAERAGVSKTLVVLYFGSKDGLFTACVERAGAPLVAAIEVAMASGAAPMEMAKDVLAAFFTTLSERPHDWNVIHDRTLPADGTAVVAAKRIRRAIADQAIRGVAPIANVQAIRDDDDLAILTGIWMSSVGSIINWWLRHPERSAEEMIERSERMIAAITDNGG